MRAAFYRYSHFLFLALLHTDNLRKPNVYGAAVKLLVIQLELPTVQPLGKLTVAKRFVSNRLLVRVLDWGKDAVRMASIPVLHLCLLSLLLKAFLLINKRDKHSP